MSKHTKSQALGFPNLEHKHTMSSLEIAELTGYKHYNILRLIRLQEAAWQKVAALKFECSYDKDQSGKRIPVFHLNALECLYVGTKFNDEARAKLVLEYVRRENESAAKEKSENFLIMDIQKKIPNQYLLFHGKNDGIDSLYFDRRMLRTYLGYTATPTKRHHEIYQHLFQTIDGICWVHMDYVLMLVRNRASLDQRKKSLHENERIRVIKLRHKDFDKKIESSLKKTLTT